MTNENNKTFALMNEPVAYQISFRIQTLMQHYGEPLVSAELLGMYSRQSFKQYCAIDQVWFENIKDIGFGLHSMSKSMELRFHLMNLNSTFGYRNVKEIIINDILPNPFRKVG